MGSPDSTKKQKDAAMRIMDWMNRKDTGKSHGAVLANLQEAMNEEPGEKVEFKQGIINAEVMEKFGQWWDMPPLEPMTPKGQQTFVEGGLPAASASSENTEMISSYHYPNADDNESVISFKSADKESHGYDDERKHDHGPDEEKVPHDDGLDTPRSQSPPRPFGDGPGPRSLDGSSLDTPQPQVPPRMLDEVNQREEEVVEKGLNQVGQPGQNVVGRAAGDKGLGNAMKYDFITAEGTGRMTSKGKNPGQVIQAGDQLGQSKRQGPKNDPRIDPDAEDPDENYEGKNLITTLDKLEMQANTKGSDAILDPIVYDSGRTSLRPQFLVGGEEQVRKTGEERMKMDVQFDMFDYVPEGFGLGAHNKMYVQEKNHDRLIRYNEPLYHPRWPDGAEITDKVFDDRLKTPATATAITGYMASEMIRAGRESQRVAKQQVRSVDSLADDNNTLPSYKGLRGHKPSPFEPVIRTASPWIPTTEPAGVNMRRQLKSVFNTQRTPQRPDEYNPNNDMPTLDRRRAQQIILP